MECSEGHNPPKNVDSIPCLTEGGTLPKRLRQPVRRLSSHNPTIVMNPAFNEIVSASALQRETEFCFLHIQEIGTNVSPQKFGIL